jgi:hypothetical protein
VLRDRTKQIPAVAFDVKEYGETSVGLIARWRNKAHAARPHALVRGLKIIDAQEHPDTASKLMADGGSLFVTISTREQDPSLRTAGPNDDPALWSAVICPRW